MRKLDISLSDEIGSDCLERIYYGSDHNVAVGSHLYAIKSNDTLRRVFMA